MREKWKVGGAGPAPPVCLEFLYKQNTVNNARRYDVVSGSFLCRFLSVCVEKNLYLAKYITWQPYTAKYP